MLPRDPDTLAHTAAGLWGGEGVRLASRADVVGGLTPLVVLEPTDVPTLSAMLRWADVERLALAPRGAGTKASWGSAPSRLDAVLSTARLSFPIDHCAGDLTVTAASGAPLETVNGILARERQWLPLDPPTFDRATVGGVVATNDSGARRQKHGTPRDLIIGVEMVRADGRVAKSGGRVVKNVAGYDLARLLCGSFGTLAVVTRATFKLAPLAPASRTVVAALADPQQLGALALAVAAGPLAPTSVELHAPPYRLLVRFETTERAADEQAARVCGLCRQHGANAMIHAGVDEHRLWREYEDSIWRADVNGILVKVAILPTDVAGVLERIIEVATSRGVGHVVGGRAALGVLYIHIHSERRPLEEADADRLAAVVTDLRRCAVDRRGSAILLSAPPEVKVLVDPWGVIGSGLKVMRAVKARFDPNGTLNPGRGPGGL